MRRLLRTFFTLAFVITLTGFVSQSQAADKKVKVFILAGQSNMEGHGQVRSLDRLGQHPKYGHLLKQLKNANAYWNEKQKKGIKDTEENHLPTKELNDEYRRLGGHWYCRYNGSAANYSLVGYALAQALNTGWDAAQATGDIVIADFEGKDYGEWKVTGSATVDEHNTAGWQTGKEKVIVASWNSRAY